MVGDSEPRPGTALCLFALLISRYTLSYTLALLLALSLVYTLTPTGCWQFGDGRTDLLTHTSTGEHAWSETQIWDIS